MDLLIGADPEFFVRRRSHFISAHPYPLGTKKRPMATQHGHIQVDGIALECNVKPAASSAEFLSNIKNVLGDMTTELHKYEPEAEIVARPSIFMGNVRLGSMPVYATRLGCEPDFDGWDGRKNPTPDPRSPFRTASGHIHVGWTKHKSVSDPEHFGDCCRLACQLDYYLGMPSLLWDDDTRRRSLYGRAGAFRPKSYGMEYRVLSNAWLRTDKLIEWVFTAARNATTTLFHEGIFLPKIYGGLAQHCINTNATDWHKKNPSLAEEVLR